LANEPAIPDGEGLGYLAKGFRLFVSKATADHILDTLERMWNSTLVWSDAHPILFIFFLLFLLAIYWVRRRSKVDIASMKLEYQDRRLVSRDQRTPELDSNPRNSGRRS
jgi:hypothetical protein